MNNSSHKSEDRPPVTVFLAATVVIFFLSLSTADSVGFVPDYIDGSTSLTTSGSDSQNNIALASLPELGEETPAVSGVAPERLIIPAIDLDLAVQNPATRDISALDALLQNGPARYVDSAQLGEVGNMIIFAHSSNLPIVRNKMYQAFNKVPELKTGDTITLTAQGKAYMYSVVSIITADATNTNIDMSPEKGTRLTLVTCDTLTGKSARYVLEASFVGTYDI
ncbi:hypothetical protein A3C20_02605 [Candidatus Kaiserbacteria bacterium RIFCSPHIGHO2_02_FULL_55_25]|uniref:Sortase n=1 Tax=Candidatus Kaiserbacteria bacterium RIFCSPHIGHO2_02_FULL_55_25 TaxID=1798498 RepID=A0A1F6E8M7_9BACT|nr:MAG: hypothetical protein A2764_03165 [Candidatus Kaiserbacteria bacterium RIFCSPHIGHO2_01_FULL_55_79]OGG70039.1 MAG: hypothetical protein A3C20_02605 [Candidatus Kaiserbacteria bacterium RIFCSPHIGHO2_02_FULL_55_25]OGG82882.1 MAG: hypothetical protein A3A42_00970 [Candidatus Kaiserbacteria bacterium RIFCSPLOWO2_01_FULL_55_25]